MSQSTLRKERFKFKRSLSAPESLPTLRQSERKAELKIILKSAASTSQESLHLSFNGGMEGCTEVAQELNEISRLVEKELRNENQTFIQQVRRILAAIRYQDAAIWEPFFEALESMVNREVHIKTFVNFTAFGVALVRRYKEESPDSPTNWIIDLVAELMVSAYERYNIDNWIQEQGGWKGVLRLIRNKCQTVVDYIPARRGMGSWRQAAVTGAGVICLIAVGAAIWHIR